MKEEALLRELANQIKIARKRSGKSQLEVLNDTGINIARIEQYAPSIKLFTYLRLCKYLNINPEELIEQVEKNLTLTYAGVIARN